MKISRLQELAGISPVLYHGDAFGTSSLNPSLMMHGESNNQEGIGIYFSPSLSVAESYGDKVSTIGLNSLKVVNSRDEVTKVITLHTMFSLMKYLHMKNENFWYLITDYGIYVTTPEEVKDYHLRQLADKMKLEEIRNWQISLAETGNIETFVKGWNKYIKIDALYEATSNFYAVINTSIQVTPYNF